MENYKWANGSWCLALEMIIRPKDEKKKKKSTDWTVFALLYTWLNTIFSLLKAASIQ